MHPIRSELLLLMQSSLGWAVLAVRAARASGKASAGRDLAAPQGDARIRMRATITIDIDAAEQATADRESSAIQLQFHALKRRFPQAVLDVRRRKPRSSRRPAIPTIVVPPYADD